MAAADPRAALHRGQAARAVRGGGAQPAAVCADTAAVPVGEGPAVEDSAGPLLERRGSLQTQCPAGAAVPGAAALPGVTSVRTAAQVY